MLNNLKRCRLDAFLTVDELAVQTGVPATTIRNLESGRVRYPRVATLKPLAERLNVAPSELIGTAAAEPVAP